MSQVVAARVSGFIDPLNGHYERSEIIALSSSFCDCVVVPPRCGQGLGAIAQQDS
ncbi:MAG: hypothetical protein RMX96_15940 [Nostoc sp. ChiSLP02]|nr:hypothetical protein [Nostoc sp. DedSLP05]MDZ8101487.1 hypothetical protein [Nostoc sp. DedSLP01]MDZ8186328.1 hypothetical protein [Nostoc sp. ChiSLP02]